jgi:hypothetical protein
MYVPTYWVKLTWHCTGMGKISKSDQSRNTSKNYKSEKWMGEHGPPDIPEVGSGAYEE